MWHILISDDESIERMVVKKVLTDYYGDQCTVHETANGYEAIKAAGLSRKLHIAVMDISMPEINGIDAAKEILKLHPDCMVIFLTAYEDFNYVREALTIHAIDYLLKPCSDNDLINAVDTAMQNWQDYSEYRRMTGYLRRPPESSPVKMSDGDLRNDRNNLDAIQIISYLKSHYHKELSLHDVASRFGYSEVYFCKFFKHNFNINFTTYLTNLRIDAAMELLRDPSISVKTIGKRVGYADSNYFSKVFRRITGMSPSEYRTANQQNPQ